MLVFLDEIFLFYVSGKMTIHVFFWIYISQNCLLFVTLEITLKINFYINLFAYFIFRMYPYFRSIRTIGIDNDNYVSYRHYRHLSLFLPNDNGLSACN